MKDAHEGMGGSRYFLPEMQVRARRAESCGAVHTINIRDTQEPGARSYFCLQEAGTRRRASLPPQHVAGSGTCPGPGLPGWACPAPCWLRALCSQATATSKGKNGRGAKAAPSPSPSQGKEQLLESCRPSAGALKEGARPLCTVPILISGRWKWPG